jgi:tryptophan halogenase
VRTHVLHAYASSRTSDEQALQSAAQVAGYQLQDVTIRGLNPSRSRQAWSRNCIAVGEAACTFDPVHSVDLHAIQLGLVHWLSLFPVSEEFDAERDEYNRVVQSSFERIRDFQSAHYALGRHGSRVTVTELLRHKIETFRARGDLPTYENESFTADSWQALLLGHGVIPETLGPMVEMTSPETMKQEFRRMLGFVKDTVLRQPSHDAYLRALSSQGRAQRCRNRSR